MAEVAVVDNSLVGRGGWPDHWAPGYTRVCHRRSVDWYSFLAGGLIGLGIGLIVGIWSHRRRNGD